MARPRLELRLDNLRRHRSDKKSRAAERLEADRPLFQIAFDRGLALCDLAAALKRPIPTTLDHAKRLGLRFGKRPPLAYSPTIELIQSLADPAVPLPELRRDRTKREHLAAAPGPRAPRPAPAQSNPDRARLDRANKQRADGVRRAIFAKAEALIDAGRTVSRSTNVHVKIAMRAVEVQRAEEARLGCPIETAKTLLRRRYAPVCSMAVYDGDPNLFIVGHRKDVTREELLAMAAKVAA